MARPQPIYRPVPVTGFVVVPREFLMQAFDLSWEKLVEVAQAGTDGTRFQTDSSCQENEAVIREGEGRYRNKPFLFRQNW